MSIYAGTVGLPLNISTGIAFGSYPSGVVERRVWSPDRTYEDRNVTQGASGWIHTLVNCALGGTYRVRTIFRPDGYSSANIMYGDEDTFDVESL